MSETEQDNNKRAGEEELPTASFSSSALVVVHRTNRQINKII
jgi:hypothetical protein